MAGQRTDLTYRLLGEDVSAGRTFGKVGDAAKSAHSAISTLGSALNATGTFTPLLDGVNAVSEGFSHIQESGKRTAVVMQGIGIGIAGLGAAFLAVGAKEQQSAAGLKQSIEAAGGSFSEYKGRVEETILQQEKFGHAANDTQDALSRLVQATNDPTQAINLMGLAANVAAARHISLTDAATTLAQGLAGNTRAFRQFGISLDGVGDKAGQVNRAFETLQQKLSGQAQAQADTFSGRLREMAVHFEDVVSSMSKFTPVLFAVGSGLTVVSAATDLLNKKRAEQALVAGRTVVAEGELAVAEQGTAVATEEAAVSSGLLSGVGGRAGLLRAGGLAIGGVVAGGVTKGLVGGRTGATLGDALTGAGAGAAIGSIVPGVGTLLGAGIGAGVGAVGGGLFGYYTHHDSPTSAADNPNLTGVLSALNQQQNAALTSQFEGYLPGEFDALQTPKAAKVATATEALAKAKTKLARAQEDLNKVESKGADPLAIATATARLTVAEDNLRAARYVGGDARIASATAELLSAQKEVKAAHAAPDTTSETRRVADARLGVSDARRNLKTAKGIPGLTASQVFGRLTGNLRTEQGLSADQATLVDKFGIAQPIIAQFDALEKQVPGTLHRLAKTMTHSLAEQFNKQQAEWDATAQAFADAGKRAMSSAAEALGKQMADDQMKAYAKGLKQLNFPAFDARIGAPYTQQALGGVLSGWQKSTAAANAQQGAYGILIGNMTVQANDPAKLVRDVQSRARHQALSSGMHPGQLAP